MTMRTERLRFSGAVERDPAIDAWMKEHAGELGAIAHQWFEAREFALLEMITELSNGHCAGIP
jgi:hypothetical protein